ncbi:MAG: beta-galactosidase [Lachnospiraceae bacterium]|nr:beta-galactosidase [Lachnospiraceae bacterium]
MGSFEIKDDFYLNGERFKIISGSIHYFRVVPEYWRDRLEKLKAMGCNTVETYIPWNLHEKKKGEFDFSGILDIKQFVALAAELELYVILRPSPYICAEWEFGGLPAWLLAEDGMRLRCSYAPYLKHVEEYYEKLFELLTPMQITKGGPVILFQIENEYGYYGDDTTYLCWMRDLMTRLGVEVPYVVSDGPWGDALRCGSVDGVLTTGNFGSKAEEQFGQLKKFIGDKPLMCMEFWVGWFDSWGCGEHHTADAKGHAQNLQEILERGSVNIYMFEGGTNFGFMNGSNYYDVLTPDVTSYDYDAVLTEWGDTTEKYERFREVISKFTKIPEVELSTKIEKKAYGKAALTGKVSLSSVLEDISTPVESVSPMSMEQLGQGYGYTLYQSELKKELSVEKIRLYGANDRAKIALDGKEIATLYDRELLGEKVLETPAEGKKLEILMENMGRVNFGPMLEKQHKGIKDTVVINGHQHFYWKQYPLPLDNTDRVDFEKEYAEGTPAFYRFEFAAESIGDTFLDLTGFGKGCVIVNGTNIGRFWEIGPQKRLYIPGPLLRQGINEIIVFETEGKAAEYVTLMDEPDIG